jgi:hypothetical protein
MAQPKKKARLLPGGLGSRSGGIIDSPTTRQNDNGQKPFPCLDIHQMLRGFIYFFPKQKV